MAGLGLTGPPLPPDPMGAPPVDPSMLGAPPVDPMAPPAPSFQSTDPGSIAHFIASMFQQMREADHQALDAQQDAAMQQADPMIQAMLGGAAAGPMGQPPMDPMLGFGAGAGPPVDPNAIPPLGA